MSDIEKKVDVDKEISDIDDDNMIVEEIESIFSDERFVAFKHKLQEQYALLRSVIKWSILAIIAGVSGGAITALFLLLLDKGVDYVNQRDVKYFYFALPLVLMGSSWIIYKFAPQAEGHGTEKVIEAVQRFGGKMSIKSLPYKMIATLLTLIGGGSAGKEGPSISFSGGVCSWIGNLLGLDPIDRKKIVVCGISAGFSAVFGTPISGALYAVEVLVLGRILQDTLLPALIAGIVGFATAHYFGVERMIVDALSIPHDAYKSLLWSLLGGIFFGVVSIFFIECMNFCEHISHKIKIWKPLKGLIGGLILVILVWSLPEGRIYLGIGEEVIHGALSGNHGGTIPTFSFLFKIIFTAITLSVGGSGGVLMPIFFIGTTAGVFFANIFGLDPQLFAAIGMISLLSAASNTPIAAMVLGVELFGVDAGTCITLSAIVSFIISGHRSVYPTQVIASSKSDFLRVPLMQEIGHLGTTEIKSGSTIIIPGFSTAKRMYDKAKRKKTK